MTGSSSPVRTRKAPELRRKEIVSSASRLAVSDGIEGVTLRAVATDLGVAPGLVHHYFPVVEELVAEAFGSAAGADLDQTFAAVDAAASPLDGMRQLLIHIVSDQHDPQALLWLDAWSAARSKPTLSSEVDAQMVTSQAKVAELVARGVADGSFESADPAATAWRLMTLLDGLLVQSAVRVRLFEHDVFEMVAPVVEAELGLAGGTLGLSSRSLQPPSPPKAAR